MMNRNSLPYRISRVVRKVFLIGVRYMLGKRWGHCPIKSFPERRN